MVNEPQVHRTGVQRRNQATGIKSGLLVGRPKRGIKPAMKQSSVSLPVLHWDLLAEVAKLQTEAFRLVKSPGSFSVSDLVELGTQMFLEDLIGDLGPLPKTAAERADFVRRLAEWNQKRALEMLAESAKRSAQNSDDSH